MTLEMTKRHAERRRRVVATQREPQAGQAWAAGCSSRSPSARRPSAFDGRLDRGRASSDAHGGLYHTPSTPAIHADTLVKTMATAPASSIIARALEDQIGAGELQPGDRTPSVRDLARDFGVSPATASKALNHLAALGLVEARPGVGMIVLQRRPSQLRSRDRIAIGERTGTVNRPGEYAKRLSAGEEQAEARVRAGLGSTRRARSVGAGFAMTAPTARSSTPQVGSRSMSRPAPLGSVILRQSSKAHSSTSRRPPVGESRRRTRTSTPARRTISMSRKGSQPRDVRSWSWSSSPMTRTSVR